jgi:hypothetical protein
LIADLELRVHQVAVVRVYKGERPFHGLCVVCGRA